MKRYIIFLIVVGVIISLAFALTLENETTYIFPEVKAGKIRLIKKLIPICACESTGNKNGIPTQFDKSGAVLQGKINPADTGMCQINLTAHKKEIVKMGLDISKESDNITFANWLFTKEGSTPWNWSKGCWQ